MEDLQGKYILWKYKHFLYQQYQCTRVSACLLTSNKMYCNSESITFFSWYLVSQKRKPISRLFLGSKSQKFVLVAFCKFSVALFLLFFVSLLSVNCWKALRGRQKHISNIMTFNVFFFSLWACLSNRMFRTPFWSENRPSR